MPLRVAINGFGRIGRMVFRRAMQETDLQVVAVMSSYPPETLAHLIQYDTVHGKLQGEMVAETDGFTVNGQRVKLLSDRDPPPPLEGFRYRRCGGSYREVQESGGRREAPGGRCEEGDHHRPRQG